MNSNDSLLIQIFASVLIFDEIDQLVKTNKESLCLLFDIARQENSSLILIGIANVLSLQNLMPELGMKKYSSEKKKTTKKSSTGTRRESEGEQTENTLQEINFAPYSVENLLGILKSRLAEIPHGSDAFSEQALNFCAQAVTQSLHGDVRQALGLCGLAIQRALKEVREGKAEKKNLRVEFKHMHGAWKKNSRTSQMKKLPFHQQVLLLCCLSAQEATSKQLAQDYRDKCKQAGLPAVVGSEFQDLLAGLEAVGFVKIKMNRKTEWVECLAHYEEVQFAFEQQNSDVLLKMMQ